MKRSRTLIFPMMAAALALGACTVEQTEEGEAPTVDVDPGQAPEYDVDPARVEVGTDTQTITTPDIDVEPAN